MNIEELERLKALDAKFDTIKAVAVSVVSTVAELRQKYDAANSGQADPAEVARVLSSLEGDADALSSALSTNATSGNSQVDPPAPVGEGALSAQSGEAEVTVSGSAPYQVDDEPDRPGSDTPPTQLPTDEDGGGTLVSGGEQ